jgi:hypothetical protein
VFFIGSPAYLKVKCGQNEKISDGDAFVIWQNIAASNCQVEVVGTGPGIYHLIFGNTNDSENWQYFVGEITSGVTKTMVVDPVTGKMTIDVSNEDYLRDLIRLDLVKLKGLYPSNKYLISAISDVDNKNPAKLLTDIFSFRMQTKENELSMRVVDNLTLWLTIVNKNSTTAFVNSTYNKSVASKSLLDRITRLNERNRVKPKTFGALSEKKLELLFEQATADLKNTSKKGEVVARCMVVSKLSTEVW